MRRLMATFIAILLLIISCGKDVLACDEYQTNTYVTQILFGDEAFSRSYDENFEMLKAALYLCCEQCDNQGLTKIDFLQSQKVPRVPSLSELNISYEDLMGCSHNSWEYIYTGAKKAQKNRRMVLQNTGNKVFDFGLVNNLIGSERGKCNSFAALLYYSHILADYLADDPIETEVNVKGKPIPAFSGQPYFVINGDMPSFTSEEKKQRSSYVRYSQLDYLGRAGVAMGNLGFDIMPPSNSRQQIGMIKPSGWNQQKYKDIIGTETTPGYLFERSHLIAHELAGEDGPQNLITGTQYLNRSGMYDLEDEVANYIRMTHNHVLYRVTPVFKSDNLLASGVQIEAFSVEDGGKGICRNRYYYNVQPGININYVNGSNQVSDTLFAEENCLPFAVSDPSDNNPDLLYEIRGCLKILFEDQMSSRTYTSMMDSISAIEDEARNLGVDNYRNITKYYVDLKQVQYRYFDVLKSYVPLLLMEEHFFKSAFK